MNETNVTEAPQSVSKLETAKAVFRKFRTPLIVGCVIVAAGVIAGRVLADMEESDDMIEVTEVDPQ